MTSAAAPHAPRRDTDLPATLDPERMLRAVYVARVAFAFAIFLAAVTRWLEAALTQTLFSSVSLVVAMGFTAASVAWSEGFGRPPSRGFRTAQTLFDHALVTIIVAVTGGPSSPFAAVYVLVIAVGALWLPVFTSLLAAGLASTLYLWLTLALLESGSSGAVLLQAGVFLLVAAVSALVAERLRQAGAGSERLAEELVLLRLQAADVLRTLDSGVVTVDGSARLLYANPAASRLLGVELDGREGRPVDALFGDIAPELAAVLRSSAAEGSRVERLDGTIRRRVSPVAIGIRTTVVGDAPGTRSATAVFADVSELRRNELLRLAAQRLEAVADLSASLAHEIRNPLAAIRSAVEQLAARPAMDEDGRVLGALIVRESDRLSGLLGEFLDFARVREPRLAPMDLAGLLRHIARVVAAHPDCAPGTVVAVEGADVPCAIDADEDLLTRAILNLALNGVQAMPGGGQLTLVLDTAPDPVPSAAAALGRDVAVVTVRDTGPGLHPDVIARIFQPFVSRRPGGHGLGLPVAHRAVQAHGGVLTVDTGPGGTAFQLCLPRHPRPHDAAA